VLFKKHHAKLRKAMLRSVLSGHGTLPERIPTLSAFYGFLRLLEGAFWFGWPKLGYSPVPNDQK
jgi:hypothetical protein